MKHLFGKALFTLACAGLMTAVSAAYKAEYKLSVVPGATSGWGQTATFFADCVRNKTDGRVNIKPYFGAQLMAGKHPSFFWFAAVPSTLLLPPQLTGPRRSKNLT